MTAWAFSESVVPLLLAQISACLAAGLAGSYLLRRRAARAHQILLTALFAAMFVPGGFLLVQRLELGLLTPTAAALPVTYDADQLVGWALPTEPAATLMELGVQGTPYTPAEYFAEAPKPEIPWVAIGLTAWAAATTLLLGRLLLRFVLGRRLIRRARPIETPSLCDALRTAKARMGIAGPVDLRCSENVRSPIIWCWRRVPVLLVHERALNPKANDWVGVFCHELAHRRRLDHLSGLLAELLTALLPWHPLAWWSKTRLSRLSEEACDDWVVASGQTGIDYAESLLDLAPQSQPAFLPTVVGKERTMKARIHRIVRDECGDPTVGRGWALALSVLVVGIAAGVALAQPGPMAQAPPPVSAEARPRAGGRNQALVMEGRRNVLERMLEQLRNEARRTEAELAEQGERPSERRQVLRAELAALNNQIQRTERQLAELNQVRPAPPATPARPAAARAGRVNQRLLELQTQAARMQQTLDSMDDPGSPRADALRRTLTATREEIRDIEAQAARVRQQAAEARDQARRERVEGTIEALGDQQRRMENDYVPPVVPRDRAVQAPRPEQRRRRADLQEQIAQAERQLALRPDGDEAQRLRNLIEQRRSEMQRIDRRTDPTAQPAAGRPPAGGAALEAQIDELRSEVDSLNSSMQQVQSLLTRLLAQREQSETTSRY